jgi:TolA-binding protein
MTSKPNALPTTTEPPSGAQQQMPPWLKQLDQHRKLLLTVLAVIVVIWSSGFVWSWNKQQAVVRAFQMLSVANTPTQWDEIIKRYPRTPAAPQAMLALANKQYHNGAYDAAMETYRSFQKRYPKHDMALAAELGLALCREANGAITEALTDFERLLTAHPKHYLAPQAIFGKARCLEYQGDIAGAREIYENFILENEDSAWIPQAEVALNILRRAERAAAKNMPQTPNAQDDSQNAPAPQDAEQIPALPVTP